MRDVNGNTGNSNRGNNNTNDDDDDKGFGDAMGPLNNNHPRIGFQNIGELSSNNTEQDKILQHFIQSNSFDVFGISEVNLYWPALREELLFGERMNQIFNPREPEELCIQHTPNYQTKKFSHAVRRNGNDLPKECSETTPQKPQGPERTWKMGGADIQRQKNPLPYSHLRIPPKPIEDSPTLHSFSAAL
jgi:hypothetical protein